MKKLFCAVAAAVMTVCMSVNAFAAVSNVSVRNSTLSSKPVTYSYDAAKTSEVSKSIKPIMNKLDDVKKRGTAVQMITVRSESADYKSVSFALRLSLPNSSTAEPRTSEALDYYNIEVTEIKYIHIRTKTKRAKMRRTRTYLSERSTRRTAAKAERTIYIYRQIKSLLKSSRRKRISSTGA